MSAELRLVDQLRDMNPQKHRPEPIAPRLLPTEKRQHDKPAHIRARQSAIANHVRIKHKNRRRHRQWHQHEPRRVQPPAVSVNQRPPDQKIQPRIQREMQPAKVNKIARPHPPPFAREDRRPVIHERLRQLRPRLRRQRQHPARQKQPGQQTRFQQGFWRRQHGKNQS